MFRRLNWTASTLESFITFGLLGLAYVYHRQRLPLTSCSDILAVLGRDTERTHETFIFMIMQFIPTY